MFSPAVRRFCKYASVGVSTFLFDLLLLYILIDYFSINYLFASGLAFVIAVSVNYVLSRAWVFVGTLRSVHSGYANFLLIALVGMGLVVCGMYVLVELFAVSYLFARVFVAGVTGFWNYLMNLFVNFKVAGKHG